MWRRRRALIIKVWWRRRCHSCSYLLPLQGVSPLQDGTSNLPGNHPCHLQRGHLLHCGSRSRRVEKILPVAPSPKMTPETGSNVKKSLAWLAIASQGSRKKIHAKNSPKGRFFSLIPAASPDVRTERALLKRPFSLGWCHVVVKSGGRTQCITGGDKRDKAHVAGFEPARD